MIAKGFTQLDNFVWHFILVECPNWISQVCLIMCWTQMAQQPAKFIFVTLWKSNKKGIWKDSRKPIFADEVLIVICFWQTGKFNISQQLRAYQNFCRKKSDIRGFLSILIGILVGKAAYFTSCVILLMNSFMVITGCYNNFLTFPADF